MVLLGSHFKFRGFATHYKALLPAGASGTFHGRFVVRGEDGAGEERRTQPDAEARA